MTKPNSYKYFKNTSCAFFPCHTDVSEESFNCMFCYCPLYFLGDKCGGNFKVVGESIKDCTPCLLPHADGSYEYMMKKIGENIEQM